MRGLYALYGVFSHFRGKSAGNGRAVPSARGALPQPDPGEQNLPKPGESQLLQGAWDPSFRPGSGAA